MRPDWNGFRIWPLGDLSVIPASNGHAYHRGLLPSLRPPAATTRGPFNSSADEFPAGSAGLSRAGARLTVMGTSKERTARRNRHAAEVEASQLELRKSISETERLVGESEMMLRRHRDECEESDRGSGNED